MEGNYRKNPTPPSIWSSRLRPFSQSYGINRKHFHFSSSTLLAASTICLQPLLHTAWYCRQFSTLATLYCSKLSPLNLLTVIVAPETFCAVQFVRRDFSSLLFSKVIQAPRWVCQIQSPDQKYYSEDSTIKKMLTFFIWRKGIFVGHLCWLASWRYWKTFIGTWSDRSVASLVDTVSPSFSTSITSVLGSAWWLISCWLISGDAALVEVSEAGFMVNRFLMSIVDLEVLSGGGKEDSFSGANYFSSPLFARS